MMLARNSQGQLLRRLLYAGRSGAVKLQLAAGHGQTLETAPHTRWTTSRAAT